MWCINLATGDKLSDRKWRNYYNLDNPNPRYGHFYEGSIVGILVDMDRGSINFYKDGIDLGQAFVSTDLKHGELHPFIQANCCCDISIFHPNVYPAYRAPGDEKADSLYEYEYVNEPTDPTDFNKYVDGAQMNDTIKEEEEENGQRTPRMSANANSQVVISSIKNSDKNKKSELSKSQPYGSEEGLATPNKN